jgi:hypothetical protein
MVFMDAAKVTEKQLTVKTKKKDFLVVFLILSKTG